MRKIYYYDRGIAVNVADRLSDYFSKCAQLCAQDNSGQDNHIFCQQSAYANLSNIADSVSEGTAHEPWFDIAPEFFASKNQIDVVSLSERGEVSCEYQILQHWHSFFKLFQSAQMGFGFCVGAAQAAQDSIDHVKGILDNIQSAFPEVQSENLKENHDFIHSSLQKY